MEIPIPLKAVVTRSFGNTRELEGIIVKAGTEFAVAQPIDGLRKISPERYRQLFKVRLVRPVRDDDAPPTIEKQREPQPRPDTRARPTRAAQDRKSQIQDPEPPAPRRLNPQTPAPADAPLGSPIGETTPVSLSPADPASSTSSTSSPKPRNRRRKSAG